MPYGPTSPAAAVRADPDARSVVERFAPGALDSSMVDHLVSVPLSMIVSGVLYQGEPAREFRAMWDELATLPVRVSPAPVAPSPAPPRADYENPEVAEGSAVLRRVDRGSQWATTELVIDGPAHGNPFTDVELDAVFQTEGRDPIATAGFYDGDGVYRIRICLPAQGTWVFHTRSNARSLQGLGGTILVGPPAPGARGPVSVADGFHFRYADGARFTPIGTTLYAWTHQDRQLREQTVRTLAGGPFTKVRMCVFPKSYLFNSDEPGLFPFERDAAGGWDFSRFDPAFFQQLEDGILQLARLGIQADVILFHPYDRWGFSEMPAWADDLYLRYVVRRLSGYPSVWWSLANEYDLMAAKSMEDWERFAAIVRQEDHASHLLSIHNCFTLFDFSRPWITHCSVQRTDLYKTAENVDAWRAAWGKPVVVDECGYEGDIDQGWGNLSGEELVRRAWEGAVRGGYVNHGETYLNDREELWWSKGGALVGSSVPRFKFLLGVIRAMPDGVIDPLPGDWDTPWGGADDMRVVYFGLSRPRYRWISAAPGTRWTVDVIDTWGMTVDRSPGVFEGRFRVTLPAKPYMAIRLTRAGRDDVAA